MQGASGLQVHISVTHPALSEQADAVGRALQDVGDDISYAMLDSSRRAAVERTRRADALLCVIGGVADLRGDGTVPGEWEVDAAVEGQLPVIAYASEADGQPARHGRAGYGVSRLAKFRERLRQRTTIGVRGYRHANDLCAQALHDLDSVRSRLRRAAPEAFRSINRRLRSHAEARLDAVAFSMHNMDTLYRVSRIELNLEAQGRLLAREPGGAGANTMVALSRLGLKTGVIGAVGDDPVGVDLRTLLEDEDVDVGLLFTVHGAESGRGIVIRDDMQNHLNLMTGGANDRLAEVLDLGRQLDRVLDAVRRARIVHHSSFSGPSERALQERVIEHLPEEALLTFKPSALHADSGVAGNEASLSRCDVLFVAEAELDVLMRREPEARTDHADGISRVRALYDWRNRRGHTSQLIVVLHGGMKDVARDERLTIAWGADEYEGSVVSERPLHTLENATWDATGARDAAVAGVLFGLLRGRTPTDCANLGYVLAMCASSAYLSRRGLPRSNLVRGRWRELMQVYEPPRWLDPYG